MTTARPEIFEAAADYIADHGWWKTGMPDAEMETPGSTCISKVVERLTKLKTDREADN